MPVFRVTQYFSQANMGWSETWYKEAGNLNSLVGRLNIMLDHRNDLLTRQHNILAVRVSEEGQNRKSRLFLPGKNRVDDSGLETLIGYVGDFPEGVPALSYDQVRACLHLGAFAQGNKLGLRYLAGVPDAITRTEPDTVARDVLPAWWDKFDGYCRFMCTDGWSIKVQDKGVGNPERNITRWVIQAAAPSQLGFAVPTGGALTVNVGDKVQVRAVRMLADGVRSPNGIWYVDAISETAVPDHVTYYLRGATGFDTSFIKTTGKARRNVYTYTVPTLLTYLRVGVHKRGKPFGSPRGRRTIKRYAI